MVIPHSEDSKEKPSKIEWMPHRETTTEVSLRQTLKKDAQT